MHKPLIVYVSGAPGSGKTTIARLLAAELYLPHVSSDMIQGGVAFGNPDHSREATLKNIFVPAMIDMSKRSISFVVDQVLQKGLSETDIIDRIRPYATIINVHTVCAHPVQRYTDRVNKSELPSIIARREHLLKLATSHQAKLATTAQPLELGLPVIAVNTDDGYEPSLEQVLAFIASNYER